MGLSTLEKWGFRRDWWRNQRGEYWVLGQALLGAIFILLPIVRIGTLPVMIKLIGAGGLGGLALFFGIGGVFNLGNNLTPLPHPTDDSYLVTTGVYRWVRHPIYASVIFLTLAYALWQISLCHGIGVLAFGFFFDRKATQEEIWLAAKFPNYQDYQQSVKKLLPGIY